MQASNDGCTFVDRRLLHVWPYGYCAFFDRSRCRHAAGIRLLVFQVGYRDAAPTSSASTTVRSILSAAHACIVFIPSDKIQASSHPTAPNDASLVLQRIYRVLPASAAAERGEFSTLQLVDARDGAVDMSCQMRPEHGPFVVDQCVCECKPGFESVSSACVASCSAGQVRSAKGVCGLDINDHLDQRRYRVCDCCCHCCIFVEEEIDRAAHIQRNPSW